MAVAEVQGLTKRYGAVLALDRVDIQLEAGCTGLVGANGAGKSTLIKLLLGLLRPDQGRALVLGSDVAVNPLAARARVGYLPEGSCLPGDMTAADFVGFMAQLGGLPPRPARERASEVCYQVGLEEERYRAIKGFSTGMQQRVKLAAALVHDPQLILLDEPTDGMDPQGRLDMLALIGRIRAELAVDVLVSTHLLGDVEQVCDRVVVMHAGRILASGSVAEVAGGGDPGYLVQLAGNGSDVQSALATAGLAVTPSWPFGPSQPGTPSHAGAEHQPVAGPDLVVTAPAGREGVDGSGVADIVRDVAAAHDWPLRRLVPRTASLEQAYLRLTAAAGAPVGPTGPAGALPGPTPGPAGPYGPPGPYGPGPGPGQPWPQPPPQVQPPPWSQPQQVPGPGRPAPAQVPPWMQPGGQPASPGDAQEDRR
jgi:ABC-2 type transport system ATP-binding protein